MADKTRKVKKNLAGKYYVDDSCIACDACVMAASDNFAMDEEEGFAYVKKQPLSGEEGKACREAMTTCPVESIGDNGE
jgi:ferredoxin